MRVAISAGCRLQWWVLVGLAFTSPVFATDVCKIAAAELAVTMVGTAPRVAVTLNGHAANLTLDTGAFWSNISPAAAAEMNLPLHSAPWGLMVQGIGGSETPSVASIKNFGFGGFEIHDVEFLVGGSEVGMNTAGLLGQNLLEKFDVEYDLANGKIRLLQAKGCAKAPLVYWLKAGDSYSTLTVDRIDPRVPFAIGHAMLNNAQIKVMLDSGAQVSLLTRRAAERAGVKIDSPLATPAGVTAGMGRRLINTYTAMFDSLKLGDGEEIHRTRLRIGDTDLPQNIEMLLGADFFLSHHIVVANSQRKVYFTYNGGPVFNLTAHSSAPGPSAGVATASAEETQEPAVAAGPALADADAYARRGAASEGRRDFPKALADFDRAVELEPANPEFHFRRVRVRLALHDRVGALDDLNRVLELQPEHIPALMERAEQRIQTHDSEGAKADLDKVDRLAAKQANVRIEIASGYEELDLFQPAVQQWSAWITSHPDDVSLLRAYHRRCWDRAMLGIDLNDALKDCNKAEKLSLKGQDSGILESRGLVRERLGDHDKAIADFDVSLKVNPRNAWALYGRGIAEKAKHKVAEGDADLEAAKAIEPNIAARFKLYGFEPVS